MIKLFLVLIKKPKCIVVGNQFVNLFIIEIVLIIIHIFNSFQPIELFHFDLNSVLSDNSSARLCCSTTSLSCSSISCARIHLQFYLCSLFYNSNLNEYYIYIK